VCLEYIAKGNSINSIITEGASSKQLFQFQELGYSIYRLHDPKLHTRFFDERGWDLVDSYQNVISDEFMEEVFQQRAISMMYRIRTLSEDKFIELDIPGDAELLITKTQFVYPRSLHRYGRPEQVANKKYFPFPPGENHHNWLLKNHHEFSGPGYDEYNQLKRPVVTQDLEEMQLRY